jgi:hypothetical protein
MSSRGKKKTTMAKLSREARLRERRIEKQARKEARRAGSSSHSHEDRPPAQESIGLTTTADMGRRPSVSDASAAPLKENEMDADGRPRRSPTSSRLARLSRGVWADA